MDSNTQSNTIDAQIETQVQASKNQPDMIPEPEISHKQKINALTSLINLFGKDRPTGKILASIVSDLKEKNHQMGKIKRACINYQRSVESSHKKNSERFNSQIKALYAIGK